MAEQTSIDIDARDGYEFWEQNFKKDGDRG